MICLSKSIALARRRAAQRAALGILLSAANLALGGPIAQVDAHSTLMLDGRCSWRDGSWRDVVKMIERATAETEEDRALNPIDDHIADALREHLRRHGWPENAATAAFAFVRDGAKCPKEALDAICDALHRAKSPVLFFDWHFARIAELLEHNGRHDDALRAGHLADESGGWGGTLGRTAFAWIAYQRGEWKSAFDGFTASRSGRTCALGDDLARAEWDRARARCLRELGRIDELEALAFHASISAGCIPTEHVLDAWHHDLGSRNSAAWAANRANSDATISLSGGGTLTLANQGLGPIVELASQHATILALSASDSIPMLGRLGPLHFDEAFRRVLEVGEPAIDVLLARRNALDRGPNDASVAVERRTITELLARTGSNRLKSIFFPGSSAAMPDPKSIDRNSPAGIWFTANELRELLSR